MKKKVISTVLVVVISVELIGRWCGLTNVPLYVSSDKFEYIPKPNQNVTIYRNRFATNEYSMRSDPLEKNDTTVVLLLGDSVLFGGSQVDQDSLASTILEKKLSQTFNRRIRVLNISSKSWGPDNAAAYVRQYGTFGADMIVLVFSSGDAHDGMTFKPVVGLTDTYPDKNVQWAWEKIVNFAPEILRVLWLKRDPKALNRELMIGDSPEFNPGFAYFDSLTKAKCIPYGVYLHRTTDEIERGKYDKGGNEIVAFCQQHRIPLIQAAEHHSMYIDNIHLNMEGHRFLAQFLYPFIQSHLRVAKL